ncbi:MAG TPA: diguanylate cyclase [Candidatus Limiplasma sp.]|nr:diguanylate cyclase [Candidatus Limiplasma sp.]HRX09000.1 diguanylate cyclase [Candidatus Limiplasma sp.]
MLFVESFSLVISSMIFLYIGYYSYTHRKTPGAIVFLFLMVAALFWNLGSFLEMNASTLQSKIFWRNIQQIGAFGLPIGTLFFAVAYTRQNKLMKFALAAAIPELIAVLLIFTNELHGLMRSGYSMEPSAVYGLSLVVHSTTLGSILVAYNFTMPIIAIVLLITYTRRVSTGFRKQVYTIIYSFIYTFAVAWIKMAILEQIGIYIHISVLYAPAAILIFFSVFRHQTLSLSPIAHDKVFNVINQGILVLDEYGTVLDTNSYARHTLRECFHVDSPLGKKLHDLTIGHKEVHDFIGNTGDQHTEIRIEPGAEPTYLSVSYYPLLQSNKYIGSVMIINNITMQKQFEHKLKDKAEKDHLTQLFNKFGFQKKLQKYLTNCNLQRYSVMMIDVDNFKQINDTHGHAAGDLVLRDFSRIVNDIIRTEDIACRLGGDEFVIVVPSISKATTLAIAERIRSAVELSQLELNGHMIRYTISTGIADNKDAGLSFDEILSRADTALYQAKNAARNCSAVYQECATEAP